MSTDTSPLAPTAKCGQWQDPVTLGSFDLSPLSDIELTLKSPLEGEESSFYTLRLCGAAQTACAGSSSFCAVEKDSVCGVDGESPSAGGMLVRNGTEGCNRALCSRCDVLSPSDGLLKDFAVLDGNVYKGISARLPLAPLTAAQRDKVDRRGYCSSPVVNGHEAAVDLVCDCGTTASFDQVRREDPSSCFTRMLVKTKFGCYDGFCEGRQPPGLEGGGRSGLALAMFLIAFVALMVFIGYKRGYQRLLGLSERFGRPAYSGLATSASAVGDKSSIRFTGNEDDGL